MAEESTKGINYTNTENVNRKRLLSAMERHGNNISALSKELKILSAYMRNTKTVTDDNNAAMPEPQPGVMQSDAEPDKFSTIDDFLSSTGISEQQTLDDILKGEAAAADYFATLQYGETENINSDGTHEQIASINSFLAAVENGEFSKPVTSGLYMQENEDIDPSEESIENTPIDESFFTESLAKIYIRQRKYDRALEIIRRLSLKYPEKNIYFADQIRFLEKLIINVKLK